MFLLDVYMNFKWGEGGGQWLEGLWPKVEAAAEFMMASAAVGGHGLPWHMVNTNDEHGVIGDVNAYTSFLYLAACAACTRLSHAVGDDEFGAKCSGALESGKEGLQRLLWDEDGGAWLQAWCEAEAEERGHALQGEALYGLLRAHILGLSDDMAINATQVASHLLQERKRNMTPLGLMFCSNRTIDYYWGNCKRMSVLPVAEDPASHKSILNAGFIDEDVWNSHSMTHAALSLYTQTGSASDALGVAQLVLKAYSVTMADAWDYRDTTTPYDDATGEYDQQGLPRPTVNSHYGRHTIFWAIPLALTGQQYDARERTLRFAPHPEAFVPALFSSPKTACEISTKSQRPSRTIHILHLPLLLPSAAAILRITVAMVPPQSRSPFPKLLQLLVEFLSSLLSPLLPCSSPPPPSSQTLVRCN